MKIIGLIILQLLIAFSLSHEFDNLNQNPLGNKCRSDRDCPIHFYGCRCMPDGTCDCPLAEEENVNKKTEIEKKADAPTSVPHFLASKLQCRTVMDCPIHHFGCDCIQGKCECMSIKEEVEKQADYDVERLKERGLPGSKCKSYADCLMFGSKCVDGICSDPLEEAEKKTEEPNCKLFNCEGANGKCYCSWMNELKVKNLKEGVEIEDNRLTICPNPFSCFMVNGVCVCFGFPFKLCSEKQCPEECNCWNETCFCNYLDLLKAR
jgi:hypothetical protein